MIFACLAAAALPAAALDAGVVAKLATGDSDEKAAAVTALAAARTWSPTIA